MAICTAAQAVEAMSYWIGYCEKADATSKYLVKDKSVFTSNAGSSNYTYMGKLCGVQGGAWCAMTVTEAIYSACGNSTSLAKTVMHGVYPYTACNQLYDAAPSAYKGRRGSWTPKAGDIIVFSSNGTTRQHTGMVKYVSGSTVFTIEGNVSNKCVEKSYSLNDSYIYGYVRPKYSDSSTSTTTTTMKSSTTCKVTMEILEDNRKYSAGTCKSVQLLLNGKFNAGLTIDGEWGTKTREACVAAQKKMGFAEKDCDGSLGSKTYEALMKY